MDDLTIGQLAERVGVSVSAIRFYEAKGLLFPLRNSGGQRRFRRSDIRRLSFVLIAQQIGLTIEEIKDKLDALPEGRNPTKEDWSKMSRAFRADLDQRMMVLGRLRDNLDGCIGCGCLSLKKCAIYNPQDQAGRRGTGPRYVIGAREEWPSAD
ncbi:redox-sensitive transcriptional activator SoxR [Parvularcula marina]|uniref:redox-sensitive transcriptional activator SoxR n=1 Tax=Parvularcula marina TaxID=2292771 RepID=UPI0035156765